jgi:hypothetical protein
LFLTLKSQLWQKTTEIRTKTWVTNPWVIKAEQALNPVRDLRAVLAALKAWADRAWAPADHKVANLRALVALRAARDLKAVAWVVPKVVPAVQVPWKVVTKVVVVVQEQVIQAAQAVKRAPVLVAPTAADKVVDNCHQSLTDCLLGSLHDR